MSENVHPHDVGLPEPAVRKRRRSRRLAWIMLTIAVLTAAAGWPLFGNSILFAMRIKDQPPSLALVAYALLIISSVTLVLGLWYMLVAQVERVARMVVDGGATGQIADSARGCTNCGWTFDPPDRFCRQCGRPLGGDPGGPDASGFGPA